MPSDEVIHIPTENTGTLIGTVELDQTLMYEAVPVETVPVKAIILEAIPVEAVPVEAVSVEAIPMEAIPMEAIPVEAVPVEAIPVEAVPVEAIPVEAVPVEAIPVEAIPVEAVPVVTTMTGTIKAYEIISSSSVHGGHHYPPLTVLPLLISSNPNQGEHDQEMIMVQTKEEVGECYESDKLQANSSSKDQVVTPVDEDNCFQPTMASLSASTSSAASSHSQKPRSGLKSHTSSKARAKSSRSKVSRKKRKQKKVRSKTVEGEISITKGSPSDKQDHETGQIENSLPDLSQYLKGKKLPPEGIPGIDLSDRKQLETFTKVKVNQCKDGAPKTVACTHEGCVKMFNNNSTMRKHLQSHRPREYVCTECDKAFIDNSKLKRHQLVHSGEKPFQCMFEGCGKHFSLDFNLRTHMRIHTGDRPYVCPFNDCNKSFTQSTNLKSHILTHAKKKNGRKKKDRS
ncbi:transcription factor YY2 [Manis javanica]|uniref:transcription factor YY2 n=1 Tax=Manis javanica TaxID=9974 RepID=UPI00187A8AB9|nr:transcription factor YY2 [Manis javanica]